MWCSHGAFRHLSLDRQVSFFHRPFHVVVPIRFCFVTRDEASERSESPPFSRAAVSFVFFVFVLLFVFCVFTPLVAVFPLPLCSMRDDLLHDALLATTPSSRSQWGILCGGFLVFSSTGKAYVRDTLAPSKKTKTKKEMRGMNHVWGSLFFFFFFSLLIRS